jgi:hypothetical protein
MMVNAPDTLRIEIHNQSSRNLSGAQFLNGLGHLGQREDFVDRLEEALRKE